MSYIYIDIDSEMSQKIDNLFEFVDSFNYEKEMAKVFSPIHNLEKIKLKHGTKEPFESGWCTDPNTYYKDINMKRYNAGFICGEVNNIMVLDVDVRNGGTEAINEYMREYGTIDTFTVGTPRGG